MFKKFIGIWALLLLVAGIGLTHTPPQPAAKPVAKPVAAQTTVKIEESPFDECMRAGRNLFGSAPRGFCENMHIPGMLELRLSFEYRAHRQAIEDARQQ